MNESLKSRIGIVTFWHSLNYGAVLQCFALRFVIKRLGGEVQVIPLRYGFKELSFSRKILHKIALIVRNVFGYRKKRERFLTFFENQLNIEFDDLLSLRDAAVDNYHKLIVGSDQVWNFEITSDPIFRLDFGDSAKDSLKYSYAASFGNDSISIAQKELFSNSLSDFKAISVREDSGVSILNEIGFKAVRVLDPTLLLSSRDWLDALHLSSNEVSKEKGFVLCYLLTGNQANRIIIKQAKNYARKEGRKLFIIGEREYYCLLSTNRMRYVNNLGPEEFVYLLANACMVFTNSFHGTCFSIVFRKNFCVGIDKKSKRNGRIIELLNMLQLQSCICSIGDMKPEYTDVDYNNVERILTDQQFYSLDFLKKVIDE